MNGLFGVGPLEVVVVLILVLLVFGPERLPELTRNLGSMIRAGSLVIVTLLILLLGLRPALRVIMDDKKIVAEGAIPSLTDGTGSRSVVSETGSERTIQQVQMPGLSDHTSDPVFDGLVRDVSNSPRDRLAKIVELDPDRAVDVQIVGLRKKLGEHGNLIETVRGVGYRFASP